MSVLLLHANSLHIPLQDQSVHMVCTSPPYWGLRDYGTGQWHGGDPACAHTRQTSAQEASITTASRPGNVNHEREGWRGGICGKCGAQRVDEQLGLEAIPDCLGWATGSVCGTCWICHMVAVFREVWRVLRDDGTLWLNLGDSYAANRGHQVPDSKHVNVGNNHPAKVPDGLKSKDLCGMPWRLALALQAQGWYLRSDCIWAKPNPLPESVTDRPTKAHEYVFLFSKSPHYFWDQEGVREKAVSEGLPTAESLRGKSWHDHTKRLELGQRFEGGSTKFRCVPEHGRNLRTVWTIATEPYAGAHYACFPSALVERCIKAGTSQYGVCPQCQAPWIRTVERLLGETPGANGSSFERGKTHDARVALAAVGHGERTATRQTTGWQPSCNCCCRCDDGYCVGHPGPYAPVPAIVFDPFVGSGTVPLVARALGRHGIGCDLSYPYLHDQARTRLSLAALAAWEGHSDPPRPEDHTTLPLFADRETPFPLSWRSVSSIGGNCPSPGSL